MRVYVVTDYFSGEVSAIFSSEEKARSWLENKAVQEWGWTPGEAASAIVESWPVDDE